MLNKLTSSLSEIAQPSEWNVFVQMQASLKVVIRLIQFRPSSAQFCDSILENILTWVLIAHSSRRDFYFLLPTENQLVFMRKLFSISYFRFHHQKRRSERDQNEKNSLIEGKFYRLFFFRLLTYTRRRFSQPKPANILMHDPI